MACFGLHEASADSRVALAAWPLGLPLLLTCYMSWDNSSLLLWASVLLSIKWGVNKEIQTGCWMC